jgi:hypothetical protein
MTFPTESPLLEAVSIGDQGWTTMDLLFASPRAKRVGSLTNTKTWLSCILRNNSKNGNEKTHRTKQPIEAPSFVRWSEGVRLPTSDTCSLI